GARPFIVTSSAARRRVRLDRRSRVLLLDPRASVGRAFLDAAEADERDQQEGEAHRGDDPTEREDARRPEREAHDEGEQIPSLCRTRPHAFGSLSYTPSVPRSPLRMPTAPSTGEPKTIPSPIRPVRAPSTIAS